MIPRQVIRRIHEPSIPSQALMETLMKSITLLAFFCLLATGCVPIEVPPQSAKNLNRLLSGEVLFGATVEVADIQSDNILALDAAMQTYVQSKVENFPHAKSRLRRLVKGMLDDGLLNLDYDPNLTQTASETFYKRRGNCLSFSNLFVAMAREANLDVTFQMVDIPPSFSTDGELVLLNNHINILVRGIRNDANFMRDYVIDFNRAEYIGNYDTRTVTDDYAIALYFSNVAVEFIRTGNTRDAFRYLKKAIVTYSDIPDLWVNLGVLYSRNSHPEMAVKAYSQALSIQPSNKSALVNISGTLDLLGRKEESDYYLNQAVYYRDHNPYYHYLLSQSSYKADRYQEVLGHLDEAIHLKRDEHKFYFLQGLTHQKLQSPELALESFQKAKEYAQKNRVITAYERKLQGLESQLE
jgi:tetratricopeptide (TPR) repeat protein